MMKLLISNQYGAIVMALLPFFYGMLLGKPVWLHVFLLLVWFSLYLMTYPFLNLFKPQIKNKQLYLHWTAIYAIASAVFSVPVFWWNWHVVWFGIAMLPLVAMAIYYTRTKNERALCNDFVGIAIFALAGMGAYYFSVGKFDTKIWQIASYPSLFFIGTTLYVKSMMRERKNPRYYQASIIFHSLCILAFITFQQWALALTFLPALIRAVVLPRYKLSVKQVGLTEMAVSLVFFGMLVWGTV